MKQGPPGKRGDPDFKKRRSMEMQAACDWAEQQARRKEEEAAQRKKKRDADFKKRRSIELLAGYDQNLHKLWR